MNLKFAAKYRKFCVAIPSQNLIFLQKLHITIFYSYSFYFCQLEDFTVTLVISVRLKIVNMIAFFQPIGVVKPSTPSVITNPKT